LAASSGVRQTRTTLMFPCDSKYRMPTIRAPERDIVPEGIAWNGVASFIDATKVGNWHVLSSL